jgi:putative ABC transport system ATP-binding protein
VARPEPSDEAVITCEAVGRHFVTSAADVVALDGIDLSVRPGTFVAIAGSSGSGKSTLLSIIGCVDRPTHGRVLVQQVDVTGLSRRDRRRLRRSTVITMLPQPSDNLLRRFDAIGNLQWAARTAGSTCNDPAAVLTRFGIGDCATKRVYQMSGGEQQRLALACALIGHPTVVLADEPTASLDAVNAGLVIDAIRAAATGGATIIVASHDPALIDSADAVVRLAHGRQLGHDS